MSERRGEVRDRGGEARRGILLVSPILSECKLRPRPPPLSLRRHHRQVPIHTTSVFRLRSSPSPPSLRGCRTEEVQEGEGAKSFASFSEKIRLHAH